MKDFLGNELKIDDEVIYIINAQTGSSSRRNIMLKGQIMSFKPKTVEIIRQYSCESGFNYDAVDLVTPSHICKLNIERKEV